MSAIKDVAEQLRKKVAVCRSCHIHPRVLESLENAEAAARWASVGNGDAPTELSEEVRALVRFLTTDTHAAAA